MSVVFEVGSPPRLVEYERNCIPGSLVHPVPSGQELTACLRYKTKVERLCKGLKELRRYILVVNHLQNQKVFSNVVRRSLHKLTVECKSTLKGIRRTWIAAVDRRLFTRKIVRKFVIMAVNKYRITKFKVHRLIRFICRLAKRYNVSTTFPVQPIMFYNMFIG